MAAREWKKGNREVLVNRSKESARQNEESSGELMHNVAVVCFANLLGNRFLKDLVYNFSLCTCVQVCVCECTNAQECSL